MLNLRESSRAAYYDLRDSGQLGRQQRLVLAHVKPGRDYSLRELSSLSGLEINAVSGRVNDLKKLGLLSEAPARKCTVSGRTVHPVQLPVKQEELCE